VVIKARVVRHSGTRFRSVPLARHVAYLERDGVTRDHERGKLFDAAGNEADGEAFAERCSDDRHHFRFIVSPEDATEMNDLRTYTRELIEDIARDLETRLDWVAVDHWNTDNPHVHILMRGKAANGDDLVIDRDYICETMRARAEERVTIELGPRSERDIQHALAQEISAERWTGLDRQLTLSQAREGLIDLRPSSDCDRKLHACLVGRMNVLARMDLAQEVQPGRWVLHSDTEQILRDLETRGDIIKSVHRAMAGKGWAADRSQVTIHAKTPAEHILGRLAARGFQDELSGTAYAIVQAVDGRTHHLRFSSFEATGDTPVGGIVELHHKTDRSGRQQSALKGRSDLNLADQVSARGATWLDQQLVAKHPVPLGPGFGREVAQALQQRSDRLVEFGIAARTSGQIELPPDLLDTLKKRELAAAANDIARRTGMDIQPSGLGDPVVGVYRQRLDLASGRFAMIDNGLGFQLVPWQTELEQRLGRPLSGRINQTGGVEWSFARSRTIGR
jgi:type IV secretory pathway VirD2 relaxase